jgi:hypothetical protein
MRSTIAFGAVVKQPKTWWFQWDSIAHLVKTIPSSDRGMPAELTAAELRTKAAEHDGPAGSRVLLRCGRSIATLSGCLTVQWCHADAPGLRGGGEGTA